jgi:signal transduction histidine kinase
MTVVSAFAFAFIFSVCLSALENQRNTAEHLLTQLEEAHEQLRAHAKEAEALAVAEERNRMAREIHDTLGHYLTILAVELETALKLEEHGDARLRSQLIGARRVATECLTEVRHSVAALRPTDPSTLTLDAALARLRAEFAAALPDTEITLDIEGPIQTLTPELRVALYRCAQESLTNIRKHAHATKALIRVRMRMDAREVEMTILDNGVGDDACGDGHEPGFGLLGMRERIALLGGAAMARPEPERGWRVEARVPLTPPASRCPANDMDHELTAASVGGVN